jgi:hypothetical protein
MCLAANAFDVVFNEIAWMGTISSANNEWLELYNSTDATIPLDNWGIAAQDGTPKIVLRGEIPGHGFYLLERTDDNTLPDITAQQIYTGALENTGETLFLLDTSNKLIDRAGLDSGWLAGDNSTKQTMVRKDAIINGETPLAWQTSQSPGGTPGKENTNLYSPTVTASPAIASPSPLTSAPTNPPTPQITLPATTSSGVVFNELLPSPAGPDETEEWIELFNQNSFSVSLSHWQITDFFGKTKKYSFPDGTTINGLGYLVVARPESGITLNNQEDKLSLIDETGRVIDIAQYLTAPRNQSFSRFGGEWQWTMIITPGDVNQKDNSKETSSITVNVTATKDIDQNLTAEITKQNVQEPLKRDSLSPTLIVALAIFVASICGASILVLFQEKTPRI